MTEDEMIAVIKAYKEGKPIQVKHRGATGKGDNGWLDQPNPTWNFYTADYRVKPAEFVWVAVKYADGSYGGANRMEEAVLERYIKQRAKLRTSLPIDSFVVFRHSQSVMFPVSAP